MTNTLIVKTGIQNYAILDGFVSKKGIKKEKIKTRNGEMDKVSFTLITRDMSERMMKLLGVTEDDIYVLENENGKTEYMCINVEALSYNAIFCKGLKANNRVQLLGEFKTRYYNGKTLLHFLLSTKPTIIS